MAGALGFKSAGGRSTSSIRLAIGGKLDKNESLQLSGMERIIFEEFNKLNTDLLALNESFIDSFKKTLNGVKTFATQTWNAVTNAISYFYQNIITLILNDRLAIEKFVKKNIGCVKKTKVVKMNTNKKTRKYKK